MQAEFPILAVEKAVDFSTCSSSLPRPMITGLEQFKRNCMRNLQFWAWNRTCGPAIDADAL